MAVYTALEPEALAAWIAPLEVGVPSHWRGIESGIENSNFFVTTRDGERDRHFVLTLFERLALDELPYYLSLMQHLAVRDIPCPAPVADRAGRLCSMLAGKPAALVTRLSGVSVMRTETAHCAALGALLARLHRGAATFPDRHPNPRGMDWWVATSATVRDHLDASRRALLDDEIAVQRATWRDATAALPRGPIHADLFRDNALFVGEQDDVRLGGLIDFYFAGDDVWILDIAICLNDWCVDVDTGIVDEARRRAFLRAYQDERPLSPAEHAALPLALRAAALRFWLSRLDDLHRPRPAQLLVPHDPGRFERLLRLRRDEAGGTPSANGRPT